MGWNMVHIQSMKTSPWDDDVEAHRALDERDLNVRDVMIEPDLLSIPCRLVGVECPLASWVLVKS